MRKVTALILALSLILVPVTSMIGSAMGFSGEHVHYDHAWHSAAEWMQAKASSHGHHHGSDRHHDADRPAPHDHDDAENGAPLKHSHADQVHAAAFVLASAPQLFQPDLLTTVASAPTSSPVQQHPHPPFRPPQSV